MQQYARRAPVRNRPANAAFIEPYNYPYGQGDGSFQPATVPVDTRFGASTPLMAGTNPTGPEPTFSPPPYERQPRYQLPPVYDAPSARPTTGYYQRPTASYSPSPNAAEPYQPMPAYGPQQLRQQRAMEREMELREAQAEMEHQQALQAIRQRGSAPSPAPVASTNTQRPAPLPAAPRPERKPAPKQKAKTEKPGWFDGITKEHPYLWALFKFVAATTFTVTIGAPLASGIAEGAGAGKGVLKFIDQFSGSDGVGEAAALVLTLMVLKALYDYLSGPKVEKENARDNDIDMAALERSMSRPGPN